MPKGQYPRKKGAKRGPYKRTTIEDRYWRYVVVQNGCWQWTGATVGTGYGALRNPGGGSGISLAHRVSWAIHHGAVPEGLHVLHRCDNPPCTNPAHLFLGTAATNALDKVEKGRARANPDWRPPFTVLTPAAVQDIRSRYRPYKVTFKMLAAEYGVSISTIQEAVHKRSWRKIE